MNQELLTLLQRAEAGDAKAQNELGICYYKGRGVEENFTKAAEWFRTAAEQGYTEAQYRLGLYYFDVESDWTESFKWYLKAAENGHAQAQFSVGCRYYRGEETEQDIAKAMKWFRTAAEQGFLEAQIKLARLYTYGDQEIEQNWTEATRWYRAAAEQGDINAQYQLGYCYYKGLGVDQDYTEAVKWHRAAAEQKDADAQCYLGIYYENGWGVEQDYAEAVRWYRLGAERGSLLAETNLGICYENGWGVEQDYAEAVQHYQTAAKGGYTKAQNHLGKCYEKGRGIEQDYIEALLWYHHAADQGHAPAQYHLGVCYENGRGNEQDYTEAVKWYQAAAEQGHTQAQKKLANCYERGHGVDRNPIEAERWRNLSQSVVDEESDDTEQPVQNTQPTRNRQHQYLILTKEEKTSGVSYPLGRIIHSSVSQGILGYVDVETNQFYRVETSVSWPWDLSSNDHKEYQSFFQPLTIFRIEAQLRHGVGTHTFLELVRILERDATCPALEELLNEYTDITEIQDEILGKFTLDKELSSFRQIIEWKNQTVDIAFSVDRYKPETWQSSLDTLKEQATDLEALDRKTREAAARFVVEEKNNWLPDQNDEEPEDITPEAFAARLKLTNIWLSGDLLEVDYDNNGDDEHPVMIVYNLKTGKIWYQ